MTNSMGLKKKLSIGVLTAALCASTCAGGLLIEANAEGADAADLVTVTGGATVTAAKSYTTTAGDYTTPKGLYIAAPSDKALSYGVELNGIFTGSTGIKAYFPGEGFWGTTAQTTITVTSVADAGETFQVHIGGEWQRYGYVTYDWNGETLYRTVNSYADNGTYYYREDNVKDIGSAQYLPIQGWMESDGGRLEPYIGFEMQADGTFNVVLVSGHSAGVHKTIASFCEEKMTFTPTTEESGTAPNLPKISFANGYTVSVKVTGAIDFLLYDVTTEEGEISFDTDTVSYEPVWYTRGTAMPVFEDIPVLPGVQMDSDTQFTVPALTYTAGEDAELTVAWIKPDNSESPTQVGGTLLMTDMGDHILRYTVMADGVPYVKELTVHVCDYATFVSGKPATCISEGEGLFTCVHGNALERAVPADENAHSVAYNEQINPTCTTEGVKACWECLYCHKYFAEADCAEELTDLSLPIDPDAHTYWAKWTWDGETPSVEFYCKDCDAEAECTEEIKVVESEEESVDATCQTEGKKVLEASVVFGGYRYIDLHEAVIPVAPHALTAVAEKPSTCMEEGTKAYYICSTCGKIFLDAEGKTETTLEELTIPTGGHQLKEVPAKESTCVEEGNKAYWECSICGKLFLDAEGKTETSREEVSLPTSGQHNMVQVPAKAPTCTEDGNSAYYKCSVCGRCSSDDKGEMEIDESSMKLPATGHKFENGVCTVCGAEDPGDGASDGLTGGQIAAIVVAAVVVAAGVVVAVVLVVRKKKLGGQK